MRPPITYYGGKQRLVKELIALIPRHRHYVEAFMGGGALFFRKPPSPAETINDLSGEVTNFYEQVQNNFENLKKKIDGTLHSRAIHQQAKKVYQHPDKFDPVTRAWAFWILTNQGFSGKIGSWALSKDNKVGKTLAIKREQFIKTYAERLKHVQIESKDALKIIKHYDAPDTFFYLDPPYYNSDCGHYSGYTEADYQKLLELLTTIKGKFLLSSYPSDILSSYIAKHPWQYKEIKQKISVTHQTQKQKTEVMVCNYDIKETQAENKVEISVPPVHFSGGKSKQAAAENLPNNSRSCLHPARAKHYLAGQKKNTSPPVGQPANFRKKLEDIILNGKDSASTPEGKTMFQALPAEPGAVLEMIHEHKLLYKGRMNNYYVLGELPLNLKILDITVRVEEATSQKRMRFKLDLYELTQVKEIVKQIADTFFVKENLIEADLITLTDLIEKYRDDLVLKAQQQNGEKQPPSQEAIKPAREKEAIGFLTEPKLMERLDKLLLQAGIIGQEQIRPLLFLAGASYKSDTPLHIEIKGSCAIVRNFIHALGHCLPKEDTVLLNDVSARLFYHCTNNELMHKVLLLPKVLDKKALKALQDLQEEETLSVATTIKNKLGNRVSSLKQVRSHFSTLMCGSNKENNTALKVTMDESAEEMGKLVTVANQQLCGNFNAEAQNKAIILLQDLVRCIKPAEVIHPSAGKIQLPVETDDFFSATILYQSLVKQLSLFHQYQRKRDEKGRLIAEPEDLQLASGMLFNSFHSDELEPALRKFYNNIIRYVKIQRPDNPEQYTFSMRELRQVYPLSKTSCFEYMQELIELEYIHCVGNAKRGFTYSVISFENNSQPLNHKKQAMPEQLHQP